MASLCNRTLSRCCCVSVELPLSSKLSAGAHEDLGQGPETPACLAKCLSRSISCTARQGALPRVARSRTHRTRTAADLPRATVTGPPLAMHCMRFGMDLAYPGSCMHALGRQLRPTTRAASLERRCQALEALEAALGRTGRYTPIVRDFGFLIRPPAASQRADRCQSQGCWCLITTSFLPPSINPARRPLILDISRCLDTTWASALLGGVGSAQDATVGALRLHKRSMPKSITHTAATRTHPPLLDCDLLADHPLTRPPLTVAVSAT